MNKLLAAIMAATIIGSLAFMQPTNVEALCPEDNPDCCPPHMLPICAGMQLSQDYWEVGCLSCGTPDFDKTVMDYLVLDAARGIELDQKIDALGDDMSDKFGGIIVTEGIIIGLLSASILIGIVNLIKRK